MSWTECPTCGWALTGNLGSPCTNTACESHPRPDTSTPGANEAPEVELLTKEEAYLRAFEQARASANRVTRRGNPIGKGRKVTPARLALPPPITPEQIVAAAVREARERDLAAKAKTKARKQGRSQKAARKRSR